MSNSNLEALATSSRKAALIGVAGLLALVVGYGYVASSLSQLEDQVKAQKLALKALQSAGDEESKNLEALKLQEEAWKAEYAKCLRGEASSPIASAQITPTFPKEVTGNHDSVVWFEAQLQNKTITNASFNGAKLSRPRFYSSKLSNTSFRGAELNSADFRASQFDFVDFSGANLIGADFYGATGLSSITWSKGTICPDGASATNGTCDGHFIQYPWNK